MDNRITIILELLSAGVIASLVAGIFSLVIAVSYTHLDVYKRQMYRSVESEPQLLAEYKIMRIK